MGSYISFNYSIAGHVAESGGVSYLVWVELFSVHWCRVLDHHQCVESKTLAIEVLEVGKGLGS